MDDFICQDGDLELDSLSDAQPMEAGHQRVGDVIGSSACYYRKVRFYMTA